MLKIIKVSLTSITLIITPWLSYDPVNLPRFVVLTVSSTLLLGLILVNARKIYVSNLRKLVNISIFMVSWMILSLIFSGIKLSEGFYGITGRHTGFLTYFGLTILMISAARVSNIKFNYSIGKVLITTSALSSTYGIVQKVGADPISWRNPNNALIGFLGNPNFHSAFIGIGVTYTFVILIFKRNLKLESLLYICVLLIGMINIYFSQSTQGFVIFFAGSITAIIIWLRKNKYNKLYITALVASPFLVIYFILDLLQKNPVSSILYEDSVSFRGDFWRAAWQMGLAKPIFGVGLDGFRDNYRIYRDFTAASRDQNPRVDSAHNIFLDLFASGGLPLLLSYILLNIYVLYLVFNRIINQNDFNPAFIGILCAWVSYQTQALVSINNIGLSIWGWVLTGALAGYCLPTESLEGKKQFRSNVKFRAVMGISLLIGISLSLPSFLADRKFRTAIESGDVIKINSAINTWPQSLRYSLIVINLYQQAGLNELSKNLVVNTVKIYPKNFEAWELYSRAQGISKTERDLTVRKMQELDPNNNSIA